MRPRTRSSAPSASASRSRTSPAPAVGLRRSVRRRALAVAASPPRGSRLRAAALASASWSPAGAGGACASLQLDHSVLAPAIGTAERAVVEVEEPPRPGSFDQRMKALVLRWGDAARPRAGAARAPARPFAAAGSAAQADRRAAAPPGPSNGFDEATWLRRQGIHAVLRAQSFRIVGRRGGVSGVGDRVGRWLSGDSAPGLSGERRDVIEAIVLGTDLRSGPGPARGLPRHGPLPLPRRRTG